MLHTVQNKFAFPASWMRTFVVALFFVTLSAGLFWLDFFRSYRAEMTILVVSRTDTSQSGVAVAENLAGITRTLSFYDRVLADNNFIDDAFLGYAPDKRKKAWNDMVSVRKLDGGSVLTLSATGDTSEEAAVLAKQTAQTLFSVASLYYNVKTDVDIRVIDGPLLRYALVSPLLFGAVSLFTGFFITTLFFLLLNAVPEFIVRRKKNLLLDETAVRQNISLEKYVVPEKAYPEFSPGETVPWIDPKKFIPAKPRALSFENTLQETKKSMPSVAHAPAPANLPVAPSEMELPVADEVFLPFEFEAPALDLEVSFPSKQGDPLGFPIRGEHSIMASMETPSQGESDSTTDRGEPTTDEYKRRLNELLSGNN